MLHTKRLSLHKVEMIEFPSFPLTPIRTKIRIVPVVMQNVQKKFLHLEILTLRAVIR